MNATQIVIAIITAVLGSGGVATVLTTFLSNKKYKAEADMLKQQIEDARAESEHKANEYIRSQLKELSDTHKQESDDLRRQNRDLSERISALNDKINQLMTWVVIDNNSYRSWLENELRKLKPDIEFPKCRPAPGFNNTSDETVDEHYVDEHEE